MRSKFEKRIAKDLRAKGVKYTYETYKYPYEEPLRKNMAHCGDCGGKNLMRQGWYTPDFFLSNGVIIETKGRFTAADRRKMVAARDGNKELKDIKMLFMRDNRIHKNSKTFYSDWCMENKFDFAIGQLKEEWLK